MGKFDILQLIHQKLTHQNLAFEIHTCAIINGRFLDMVEYLFDR